MSLVFTSSVASGQPSTTQVAFVPGGQDLFVVDLAGVRAGTMPGGIQVLSGNFSVVNRNGTTMLRVTHRSEFLIRLPNDQRLPQNFTIEVDLVPKANGPEPDLTLEGMPSIDQGDASAHVRFLADASFGYFQIVGGESTHPSLPIPNAIRGSLPEVLTKVGVSVEGSTIRFFVNGHEIYPDPTQPAQKVQAQFMRGNVLRVTLGGVTEGNVVQPVYVARVRVATGSPATLITAIGPAAIGATLAIPPADNRMSPAPASRTIALSGIYGAGGATILASRTIHIAGLTATGAVSGVGAQTIALPPIQASGAVTTSGGTPGAPATRTITLAAVVGSGGSGLTPARSVTLPGITATGGSAAPRSRTIQLPGVTASGSSITP